MSRSSLTAALAFALTLVCAVYAGQDGGALELKVPAPVPDGRAAVLDRLDEISCRECHARVVDEWAGTSHALAWVDELYQDDMQDRRRPQTCHGCHIPGPVHADLGGRPDPREVGLHFGVSCESCHVDTDGVTLLGPRGIETEHHPVRKSDTMVGAGSNELCASCHSTNVGPVIGIAKDFVASDQGAKGRTCVGCHMAPVEREHGSTGLSHALQTPRDPAFLRQAFSLAASTDGLKTVVRVGNRTGHRVPGLIGRDLVFTARVLDGNGDVLGEGELRLNNRSFLPVDDGVELTLDAAGGAVRVTALHHDPRLDDPVPFLDETLTPEAR
jgi:hypothetical protein